MKISDFGLARALATGEEYNGPAFTMTHMALGTPDFVAPEALDGDSVEPTADTGSGTTTATGIASASKDKPFENSLGMRFVPVLITGGPSDGKTVLFSVRETRVKDYETFIKHNRDREWSEPDFEQEADPPALNMIWEGTYGNGVKTG